MEDDKDIIELKNKINKLEKVTLIEVFLYIDELIKAYEDQHKA